VNPLRWRNKDTANIMVSAAGVMANTLIAVSALVIVKSFQAAGLFSSFRETRTFFEGTIPGNIAEPVFLLLYMSIVMNASLAVFNLLPFPPLDGSKILETFLPPSMQPLLATLEQYGYLILMAAIYFGLFRMIFRPFDILITYLLLL
jgi:Zn-dependent protease